MEETKYLTTREVADLLGLHVDTVKKLRGLRKGPPFVKIGPQSVRYKRSDVIAWADAQREAAA